MDSDQFPALYSGSWSFSQPPAQKRPLTEELLPVEAKRHKQQPQQTTGAPCKAQSTSREDEQLRRSVGEFSETALAARRDDRRLFDAELGIRFSPVYTPVPASPLASCGKRDRTELSSAVSVPKKQKQTNPTYEIDYVAFSSAMYHVACQLALRAEEAEVSDRPVAPTLSAQPPIPHTALLPVPRPRAAANPSHSDYFKSSGWVDPADLRSDRAVRKELTRRIGHIPSKSSPEDLRARYEMEFKNRRRHRTPRPNLACPGSEWW